MYVVLDVCGFLINTFLFNSPKYCTLFSPLTSTRAVCDNLIKKRSVFFFNSVKACLVCLNRVFKSKYDNDENVNIFAVS